MMMQTCLENDDDDTSDDDDANKDNDNDDDDNDDDDTDDVPIFLSGHSQYTGPHLLYLMTYFHFPFHLI